MRAAFSDGGIIYGSVRGDRNRCGVVRVGQIIDVKSANVYGEPLGRSVVGARVRFNRPVDYTDGWVSFVFLLATVEDLAEVVGFRSYG